MRYQPGYGYIPEDGQELAGLKKFFKRLTVKLVKLDPLSKAIFMPKQDAPAEAAASPIPEMPTGMPDAQTAPPIAPPMAPAAAAGPSYYGSEPMPDPEEETEGGPPQPVQAGLFSGGLSPLLMIAGAILFLSLGKGAMGMKKPVRRRRRR